MKKVIYVFMGLILLGTAELIGGEEKTLVAQSGHTEHQMPGPTQRQATPRGDMKHQETHEHVEHPMTMPSGSSLHPAEGASVKILSPKSAEVFNGDEVPIHFQLVKGKKGHHVHAYVDDELMGMFSSEKGTLTGIQPGHHILELRVVAEDHRTELEATDRIEFLVK